MQLACLSAIPVAAVLATLAANKVADPAEAAIAAALDEAANASALAEAAMAFAAMASDLQPASAAGGHTG